MATQSTSRSDALTKSIERIALRVPSVRAEVANDLATVAIHDLGPHLSDVVRL